VKGVGRRPGRGHQKKEAYRGVRTESESEIKTTIWKEKNFDRNTSGEGETRQDRRQKKKGKEGKDLQNTSPKRDEVAPAP